jgi:hypothetical protein
MGKISGQLRFLGSWMAMSGAWGILPQGRVEMPKLSGKPLCAKLH